MNFLKLIDKAISYIKPITKWKAALCLLMAMYTPVTLSATIIQNGRGLVGILDSNISATLTGTSNYWATQPSSYVLLAFFQDGASCNQSLMMEIDGVKGIKFNTAGTLMLVPEITYVDKRTWGGNSDTVTGIFTGYGSSTSDNLGEYTSCILQPYQSSPSSSVDVIMTHNVTATGRILIYGTGQQVSSSTAGLSYPLKMVIQNPRIAPAQYAKNILVSTGSWSTVVSDLACTLATPTLIDFGPQPANAAANQLLAAKTVNLSVGCQQSQNKIAATLSLMARTNLAYYSGNDNQVNLNNSAGTAGAYVTMDINVNGTSKPVSFNRQYIDIGSIDSTQSAANFNYPVTYTLYSKGTGMTGKVSGSAELSIVMR
ncbi:hypothetical protein SOASR032_25330 [Pragia fontium]|uniref:Fimbrial protein n=1 Tax=Pragia fontium TaxID=82985 RepID=A0ABQ5LL44_9GAMM|nr:hypothetical protein [Pragia fontium]GKX63964.1 hypothetical protein SOASR032_25330 [Pragia fontium]